MTPFEPAGAALLAAGRHRYAPKVLIGLLFAVLILALAIGIRTSPLSRADVPSAPLATTAAGGLPGSGEGTITGVTGGRFLISVSDSTPSLQLGVRDGLRIRLTNPTDQDLMLATLTTTVLDRGDDRCRAEWFEVGDYDAKVDDPVSIPAGGDSAVTVSLRLVNLSDVNQDACQGASIPIRLTGTASLT